MKINIAVTSDFICPWCYLGKARLFKALSSLGQGVEVAIDWKPYELNPDMPAQGLDRRTYRTRKFGWERSLQMDAHLTTLGQEDGIVFDFGRIERTPNTRLAHRLTLFADRHGRQTPYALKVFEAYFTHGKDIGRTEVLLSVISDIGSDSNEARRFMEAGEGLDVVIEAEREARARGIQGVPHFDIGSLPISGAQQWQVLRDAVMQAGA